MVLTSISNGFRSRAKYEASVFSVALLSGVFKLSDLQEAQNAGLYLVWAHDVDGFVEWIKTQIAD